MTDGLEEAGFPPSLDAAILVLQADLPVVAKTRTADVRTQTRNYSYDYADLFDVSEALFPRLAALGLIWVTKPTLLPDGKTFALVYKLKHVPSGEVEEGMFPLPTGVSQALGSAVSFARRYCLCAVTGLVPKGDDDDGAAAGRPPSTAQRQRRRAAQPAAPEHAAQRARPPGPPLPGEDGHGQPPSGPPQANGAAGGLTPQMRKILAMLGGHGVNGRNERLDICSRIVRRPLGSGTAMTPAESSAVITVLTKAEEEADRSKQPFGQCLDQMIHAATGDDGVPEPPPGVGVSPEEQAALLAGGPPS